LQQEKLEHGQLQDSSDSLQQQEETHIRDVLGLGVRVSGAVVAACCGPQVLPALEEVARLLPACCSFVESLASCRFAGDFRSQCTAGGHLAAVCGGLAATLVGQSRVGTCECACQEEGSSTNNALREEEAQMDIACEVPRFALDCLDVHLVDLSAALGRELVLIQNTLVHVASKAIASDQPCPSRSKEVLPKKVDGECIFWKQDEAADGNAGDLSARAKPVARVHANARIVAHASRPVAHTLAYDAIHHEQIASAKTPTCEINRVIEEAVGCGSLGMMAWHCESCMHACWRPVTRALKACMGMGALKGTCKGLNVQNALRELNYSSASGKYKLGAMPRSDVGMLEATQQCQKLHSHAVVFSEGR
jgi:hypothetical protein